MQSLHLKEGITTPVMDHISQDETETVQQKTTNPHLQNFGNGIAFYDYLAPYTGSLLLYNVTTYGQAFLTGSQANNYASNATNCFNRALNVWFYEFPQIEWYYFYGAWEDNLFNTTRELANVTNAAMVCYDALENFSEQALTQYQQFASFTDFMMAFFQNILGSISLLLNIYKVMQAAATSGDYVTIATQIGKLVNILLNVQPIQMGGSDLNSKMKPILHQSR